MEQSPSPQPMPDVIHCLICTILAIQAYETEKKKGTPESEIMVLLPRPVYTWRIVVVNQMPVNQPVCMEHVNYSEQSLLAVN